jgi:tetratricopeptide (TPR) repeat protein
MRKDGSIPQQNNTPNSNASSKETLTFNKAEEEKLINVYNKKSNNLIDQHFISIALQDLYYKYRNLDSIYLDKCIEYCQDDISKLNEMQKQYVEDEQRKILSSPLLSPLEREQKLSKVDLFRGSIPAFKRLAIIYEKNKDYEKAISICNQAISYYSSVNMQTMISEFEERQNKLINKKNALNT